MEFTNVGKTFQLVINNGEDLKNVLTLDEALWGATSAPAAAFACDPVLVSILDPNKTGRITSNVIKEAIKWFLDKINNPAGVTEEFKGELQLADINTQNAQALVDSATYILKELGTPEATSITLKQIRDFFASVAKRAFNGDGIISLTGAAVISEDFKAFITDVIAATGGTPDADGTVGASPQNITDFLAAAKDLLAWIDAGKLPEGQETSDILPRGADTAALAALVKSADPLVTQFFKLSGLLGFDERIAPKSMAPDAKVAAFDPANQPEVDAYLGSLPIAKPNPESILTLDLNVINPIHRNLWSQVITKVLKPILGEELQALTPEQWAQIKALFAPYEAYMATKKGAIAEKISADKLRAYVADEQLTTLTADAAVKDKIVTDIITAAKEVEKLILFRTFLLKLVNNFVSFPELYSIEKHAMFECGSLVIDGRWFNLAFSVDNVAAHQAVAKTSLLCIMYVEVEKAPGTKVNMVFPVTYGSKGNLAVGKRGVFFDFGGKEYDAKITQLIVNPVCVREALLAPFIKMWTLVEGKIETWSATTEKTITADFNKAIANPTAIAAKPTQPTPPPQKPQGDKSGMLLGASVAVAALGSAFAFISNTLSNMSGGAILITIICAILVLIAPISILAMIKLRKQDLSALLEGCGWAINLRMKLTSKLRGQFTNYGKYPEDAKGTPKHRGLLALILVVLIIVAIFFCVKWVENNTEWGRKYGNPKPAASVAPSVPAAKSAAAPAKPAAAPAKPAAAPAAAKPAPAPAKK